MKKQKLIRIVKGDYVYKGMNGDIYIHKKEGKNWTVSGEVIGEFFRSTVESFRDARNIAFNTDK